MESKCFEKYEKNEFSFALAAVFKNVTVMGLFGKS